MSERVAVAAQPDRPVTEAVTSLEMRWMFPGELDTAVAGWFSRFPAETQTYEDLYLLSPPLPGLAVKMRSGHALQVKAHRGDHGMLEITGRARGAPAVLAEMVASPRPAQHGRRPARQLDTRAQVPAGQPFRPGRRPGRHGNTVPAGRPPCSVELAQARADGEAWWTIGFEATG